MAKKVLHSVFFSSGIGLEGIVVTENEVGTRKAYIGPIEGIDEQADIKNIMEHGAPVYPAALEEILRHLKGGD